MEIPLKPLGPKEQSPLIVRSFYYEERATLYYRRGVITGVVGAVLAVLGAGGMPFGVTLALKEGEGGIAYLCLALFVIGCAFLAFAYLSYRKSQEPHIERNCLAW